MNITISGLTACGKSYQAKALATKIGFKYINASSLLIEYANLGEFTKQFLSGHGWLDIKMLSGIEVTRDGGAFDRAVDKELLRIADRMTGYIIDARTTPYLCTSRDIIKIYLNPSLDDRVRICYGSRLDKNYSPDELVALIRDKDDRDFKLFKNLYNIDVRDTRGFDLVLNNGNLNPEETSDIINTYVKSLI